MRRIRKMTASIAVAAAVTASSLGLAAAAQAAPARPAGTGSFRTWPAAQKAARFKLIKPSKTFGLKRAGEIYVSACAPPTLAVSASYGKPSKTLLSIAQDNSSQPCGNFGVAKNLGRYRVDGVWAHLFGVCGIPEMPVSCSSRNIWLHLIWIKHHVFYQADSHDQWRKTIVSFARGLVPVT